MKYNTPLKVAAIAGLVVGLGNVYAASLGAALPGAAQPDNVVRALESQQPVQPQRPAPPVQAPEEKKPVVNTEAEKIKFVLNKIVLKGNTVYSDAELQPLYADKLKTKITVNDLFNIVQSISNFYRNNGYILSRGILPPQHVKNGVVKVEIIEGYLDKVNVEGNPRYAKCMIERFGKKIAECKPLKLDRMQKYLILANEIPGATVRAVLAPSKTETGAADLNMVADTKLYNGYFSYDNYGTRYIGPQQMTASASLNSFILPGDATTVTVTKTPKGGELTYNDLNYNAPVDDEGTRVLVGATRAGTHPLFVLQPAQVDGLNINYYSNFSFPLIRDRDAYLTGRITFNYLDSTVTSFDQLLYTDHLRNLDLGLTYNFSDRWYGSNLLSGDFRQGLPILGYTSNQNPDTAQTSRPGGRGDYTKFNLMASRLQAIKGPVSLYVLGQGQWAFNPLLASEQFTFGGSQLGRGYDIAEILGDRGIAGTVELRYDKPIGALLINSLQFYTFYDAGMVWNYKFLGGVPIRQNGTSTGFGVRFFMTKYISGNGMWTQTLTRPVAAQELINQGSRPRLWFSIIASYAK